MHLLMLTRDPVAHPDSHHAIIVADELEQWQAAGWDVEGDEPTLFAAASLDEATAPGAFNGADPSAFDHDGDGAPGGSAPAPQPVGQPIPENWADLHWTQRLKLAKELGAGEDVSTASEADAFIQAKIDASAAQG